MAEHVWSVLCRKAVIEQTTNQLSLNEILENITTEVNLEDTKGKDELLFLPLEFSLVSYWIRSVSKKSEGLSYLKSTLKCPDKSEHVQPEQKIDLRKFEKIRLVIKGQGIPFGGYGTYYFVVQYRKSKRKGERWIKVATIPLTMSFKKE